jgi:zinc transport system ATP-binding protein
MDRAFPITVEQVVRMGRLRRLSRRFTAEDREAVRGAMEQTEITDLAARPYSALSGGQRRRVLVARALASKPRILILDEPTANMDSGSEDRLYKTLGRLKGGTTILIVTHDTEFVSPLTDRVLCMAHNIVQHRVENSGGDEARVLHEEAIPGDTCYE